MTPMKVKCKYCGKNMHEDIYEACTKCYGTFKVTKNGLVKEEPKPLKITLNGKKTTVDPSNALYETISYYHKEMKVDPETELEIDEEDRGIPSLLDN